MAQLRRGGKELLDALNTDIDRIEDLAIDNPQAVRQLARRLRARVRDEVRPLLVRADDKQSLEQRVDELEKKLTELAATSNVRQFRKAE